MTADSGDSASLDGFLVQAAAARQRQAWDEAIKIYQVALRQLPGEPRLRLGLAQSYEAKARSLSLKPFFLMAMQEYWHVVNADPEDVKAVDGLLAASYNAGELPNVMEEFRRRMNEHPEVKAHKDIFKKIETLYLFSAAPAVATAGPRGLGHTIMARVSPLVALGCFLVWTGIQVWKAMRLKGNPAAALDMGPFLKLLEASTLRFSIFAFLACLGYYFFLKLRASR